MSDTITAGVMMTLAGIAYGQPSAIPGYLAADALTNGAWHVVWSPPDSDDPVNFAIIAKNTGGDYVIAIRGTYPNPFSPAYWDNASQDNPLGPMQPWPNSDAKVSKGTWAAFQTLIALTDGTTTFMQAVQAIPQAAQVTVTGHSLGGTLAPVVALWMTTLADAPIPTVYAFAGMTPGNTEFAGLFGPGTKLDGKIWRYNNTLDTVPYGWDRVRDTRNFYQPAPRGGLVVEAAIDGMALLLIPYRFAAIGTEITLPGVLSATTIPCEIIAYTLENLHQHLPDTYLDLLGAPALPFTIGFGAIVGPRDGTTAKRPWMPVAYR